MSVDLNTLEQSPAHVERSDVTAVPAAMVVGEAMVAYVMAAAYVDKFGGDSVAELTSRVATYLGGLGERGLWLHS
jgi:chorismate synthase